MSVKLEAFPLSFFSAKSRFVSSELLLPAALPKSGPVPDWQEYVLSTLCARELFNRNIARHAEEKEPCPERETCAWFNMDCCIGSKPKVVIGITACSSVNGAFFDDDDEEEEEEQALATWAKNDSTESAYSFGSTLERGLRPRINDLPRVEGRRLDRAREELSRELLRDPNMRLKTFQNCPPPMMLLCALLILSNSLFLSCKDTNIFSNEDFLR